MTIPIYRPQTRIQPMWPGQMGVPGSDLANGLRTQSQGVTLFVDANHLDKSDAHDGTDPEHPLATIGGAITRLGTMQTAGVICEGSVIYVAEGNYAESVVTPTSVVGPNYVTLVGLGGMGSPYWTSGLATDPCLDIRAIGWRVTGFHFGAPVTDACIVLQNQAPTVACVATGAVIDSNYFDGLAVGLYGIWQHGAAEVQILNNKFARFNNAGNTATGLVSDGVVALPLRNIVAGNEFMDGDNHMVFPGNGNMVRGNVFQAVGVTYTAIQILNTSTGANPGNHNVVTGNILPGDYSNAGGYRGGAADVWIGNLAEDIAEAEVADNGFTMLVPAA